jgi:hypothetical protein
MAEENRRWSYQDQLTLPYPLHQLQLDTDLVPHNLPRNNWFDYLRHNSDARKQRSD